MLLETNTEGRKGQQLENVQDQENGVLPEQTKTDDNGSDQASAEESPLEPEPIAFKKAKKTAPEKPQQHEKATEPNRKVVSMAVSIDQYEYLQKIFEARKESGLSENWNHFLKQCINFAVNYEKGWQFGVPNIKKVYLD